ncbi:MAG TPA: FtsQ-type POTRA domain-containing protein [Thermoanaerobaculia bacterium]|nr:FtsQ-type POTRA domain-containing protein [Thermoanaerobaculia bacterium]
MSVGHDSSSERFFRPIELGSPRNYRKLQTRRLLIGAANALLVAALMLGAFWMWRSTLENARFAIRGIEVSGLVHAPRGDVERIVETYRGRNLFRLDLESVRAAVRALPWVESVAVEKRLPGTLTIQITERTPAALVVSEEGLRYVDRHGVVFAPLSPQVGNPDLPLISDTDPAHIAETTKFLLRMQTEHPELYSRIAQVSARPPGGYSVWDRELGTVIRVGDEPAESWAALYEIARAEGIGRGGLEYADLRFRERVVLRRHQSNEDAARSSVLQ